MSALGSKRGGGHPDYYEPLLAHNGSLRWVDSNAFSFAAAVAVAVAVAVAAAVDAAASAKVNQCSRLL